MEIQCHDCKETLQKGAEYRSFTTPDGEFHKCRPCNEKDPVLRNYKKTEVYSRVCGYMRAVDAWNPGKQAEYSDRKEFKIEARPPIAAC